MTAGIIGERETRAESSESSVKFEPTSRLDGGPVGRRDDVDADAAPQDDDGGHDEGLEVENRVQQQFADGLLQEGDVGVLGSWVSTPTRAAISSSSTPFSRRSSRSARFSAATFRAAAWIFSSFYSIKVVGVSELIMEEVDIPLLLQPGSAADALPAKQHTPVCVPSSVSDFRARAQLMY